MQYTIAKGETLGGIATSKGVNMQEILKLNPSITNPNLIYAGSSLNLPDAPVVNPTPPISSTVGGVQPSLNISTSNPALKSLLDNTNQTINDFVAKGGTITPEIQQKIQAINDAENQKMVSVADARTAANNKNATGLDTAITNTNTADTTQQTTLQSLLADLKTARESTITSLAPSQAEQDLQTQLNTLRTDRQLLPIELRQEGISAPGIAGRQVEDERVRAIQEQNLLLELGLKQDARKMAETATEKQVGFITDDINLRLKIQEMLDKQEQDVIDNAQNLSKNSLAALSTIVDKWGGLAWTDLDPQSQSDLMNLIKPYPDLTIPMISDALAITKKQQVFDNAIKQQNAKDANGNLKTVDYTNAKTIITNNPKATYADLYNGIIQNTNLTGQEADAYLTANGIVKTTDQTQTTKAKFEADKFNGYTRQETLDKFKADVGHDMPPDQVAILDEVFGPAPTSTDSGAKWYNPLSWF